MAVSNCRLITGAILISTIAVGPVAWGQDAEQKNQYESDEITIPAATADEPKLEQVSLQAAADYIEKGNAAWWNRRNCVACHTSGAYVLSRPALTEQLGQPSAELRDFYVEASDKLKEKDHEKRMSGIYPTQMAYIAGGLAEWDAHVTKKLSPDTDAALRLMFEMQGEDGSWGNTTCWPPFESSAYQGTTVAAMAAATAPGWIESLDPDNDAGLLAKIEKMKDYLRSTSPPHDYGKLLLLWASTRIPDLIGAEQKQDIINTIWDLQREDGGWSIRAFAAPEAWGDGGRAEKLRAEREFEDPPSDGHQTGLAVLVLRDAGVPAADERIARGVNWLLKNQRQSGRWWTRSLNTDNYHFITYSGTCYSVLALAKCDALPASVNTAGIGAE